MINGIKRKRVFVLLSIATVIMKLYSFYLKCHDSNIFYIIAKLLFANLY